MNRKIILIAHNLRSCNNVGSLLRTADGLAVESVYLTGYTPYPIEENDTRLPYIKTKIENRIKKTSLGAESSVNWHHDSNIDQVIAKLKIDGYVIAALEQTSNSIDLDKFESIPKIAIIVGREVEGIEKEVLELVDETISIPMLGSKESFNVVQAAAMAIYKFRYF